MEPAGVARKKRVNSERRKEKSRDAARCRRGRESEVFNELANELPLPHSVAAHLDKAAIIRLALSYLRLRWLLDAGEGRPACQHPDVLPASSYLKALGGFLVLLSQDGDVIYVSENVSKCVGLLQFDLIGHSIFDFTHPCDHEDIRDVLSHRTGSCRTDWATPTYRSLLLRMKCTLTSRGRMVNIKSATWRMLHCTGHMSVCVDKPLPFLMLICQPIPHQTHIDVPLDSQTFISRHTLDMRYTYCDNRVRELLGYDADDLSGHSVYEFCHALDSAHLSKTHHSLFVKGQARTAQYRLLVRWGGFVWAETHATIIYSKKGSHPEYVVCINYVISSVEHQGVVLSVGQQCEVKREEEADVSDDEQTAALKQDDELMKDNFVISLDFNSGGEMTSVPEDQLLYNDVMLAPPYSDGSHSHIKSFSFPESSTPPPSCCTSGMLHTDCCDRFHAEQGQKVFSMETEPKNPFVSEDLENKELDMLAPYIPMDGDFKLHGFPQLSPAQIQRQTEHDPLDTSQSPDRVPLQMSKESVKNQKRAQRRRMEHNSLLDVVDDQPSRKIPKLSAGGGGGVANTTILLLLPPNVLIGQLLCPLPQLKR
ncbi:hypoxia inducible factor 1 subunit alpha a [Denticeps clupeoides]|uniref:hypoxia inducible factor 1 subunit alpha a n=1 Tax=Denticeps clupeoides TaxID=299321 RepID=UPI0010A555C9|nr:hypoxia-inducible factor 1-alpha [Denticeps clupeoides]